MNWQKKMVFVNRTGTLGLPFEDSGEASTFFAESPAVDAVTPRVCLDQQGPPSNPSSGTL